MESDLSDRADIGYKLRTGESNGRRMVPDMPSPAV